MSIYNATITELNSYKGGVYQQAVSGVTQTEQGCYELEEGCFAVYGLEYKPGFDDAVRAFSPVPCSMYDADSSISRLSSTSPGSRPTRQRGRLGPLVWEQTQQRRSAPVLYLRSPWYVPHVDLSSHLFHHAQPCSCVLVPACELGNVYELRYRRLGPLDFREHRQSEQCGVRLLVT